MKRGHDPNVKRIRKAFESESGDGGISLAIFEGSLIFLVWASRKRASENIDARVDGSKMRQKSWHSVLLSDK